jgi:hypothetical protein
MLNFTEGMATVIVGLFIVASQSVNAPISDVGRTTAIYDSRPSVPVGSCDSLAGGGAVVRCDAPDNHAQLKGNQAPSAVPGDSTWLNAVVMGPDPGGKAGKESVDREPSGAKLTPSTSPSPKPGQNPGEQESRQDRSESSWLPEDCDAQLPSVKTHCLLYLSLHVR